MRIAALIVTLTIAVAPSAAADVYRTVDAQGNVAYSDRPEDGSSVRVAVAVTAPAARAAARTPSAQPGDQRQANQQDAGPDEATIAAAEAAQRAEDRAANCEIARQRNEKYATSHRLYRVGEDGERVYFTDAETTQARTNAQAEVARWCD